MEWTELFVLLNQWLDDTIVLGSSSVRDPRDCALSCMQSFARQSSVCLPNPAATMQRDISWGLSIATRVRIDTGVLYRYEYTVLGTLIARHLFAGPNGENLDETRVKKLLYHEL